MTTLPIFKSAGWALKAVTLRLLLYTSPPIPPMPSLKLLAALSLLALTPGWAASNWPQFHGPNGSGIADPSAPPTDFGPDKNVVWKIPLPSGHSSPCIWEDRIFLTTYDKTKLQTVCLRRSDGSELWRQTAPCEVFEATHRIGSPAAPTPATDGHLVYVYFGSFGLLAYDLEGREHWRLPLKTPVVEFGTSASPVLSGGKLFLACDQDEGSFLLAVDAGSGAVLWRKERPEFRRSFATPLLWKHDNLEELVVPGSIWLKSYNPANGEENWTFSGTSRVACSSPVAGDGMLFSASWNVGGDSDSRVIMDPFEEFMRSVQKSPDSLLTKADVPAGPIRDRFSQMDLNKDGQVTREEWEAMRGMFARAGNALLAIRPGGRNEVTETHLAWKSTRSLPYVASPLFYKGRLFTIKNGGLASCYRADTGEVLYQDQRVEAAGDYYASPIAGNDKVYLASQKGVLLVLAAADALTVLSRVEFGETIMATPAIVGDTLYVRTETALYALREAR